MYSVTVELSCFIIKIIILQCWFESRTLHILDHVLYHWPVTSDLEPHCKTREKEQGTILSVLLVLFFCSVRDATYFFSYWSLSMTVTPVYVVDVGEKSIKNFRYIFQKSPVRWVRWWMLIILACNPSYLGRLRQEDQDNFDVSLYCESLTQDKCSNDMR